MTKWSPSSGSLEEVGRSPLKLATHRFLEPAESRTSQANKGDGNRFNNSFLFTGSSRSNKHVQPPSLAPSRRFHRQNPLPIVSSTQCKMPGPGSHANL